MRFEYSADQMALLEKIKSSSLEAEIGGTMEIYCEEFGVGAFEKTIFERFLLSPLISNHSMTIRALVQFGNFGGYEAQALLLHFQGRSHMEHSYPYDGINHLAKMARLGSMDADRALTLLNREEFVSEMYGGDDE